MKELLYRKIYLHLKAGITDGSLPAGERLSGVREIAAEWKTSSNTVLKALTALESDGLIRKTRGQGIFVCERTAWDKAGEAGREIGIIISDMNEPFNMRLLSAVEKAAAARGYRLTLGSLSGLSSSGVAGLIIVPSSSDYFDAASGVPSGLPAVYTGRFSPPPHFEGNYMIADVYSGFYYAAGRVLESGRERIAYLGAAGEHDGDPGRAAVRDVLSGTTYGYRREFTVSAGGFDAEQGSAAMETLLLGGEYPDAVICSNDTLAAGAMKACRAAGLNIPSDIVVIGSGDQDIAPLLEPPLTSIRIPAELLGLMTTGFLDEIISGRISLDEKIRSRLDPKLIIRGSALSAEAGNEPGAPDERAWL